MTAARARVAAMINGDFWQMTAPINPRGPVHKGGTIVSSAWDYNPLVAQQALAYVGIKDDGKMVIGPRSEYESVKNRLRECTGDKHNLNHQYESKLDSSYLNTDSAVFQFV